MTLGLLHTSVCYMHFVEIGNYMSCDHALHAFACFINVC